MHIDGPLREQESRALLYKLLLWLKYSSNMLRALWEVRWDHYGEKFLNPKTPRIPNETHPLTSRQGFSIGNMAFTMARGLLASHMLLDLIHLRKNYSSIDTFLGDGLDCWSCRSWRREDRIGHCQTSPTIWTVFIFNSMPPAPEGFLCLAKCSPGYMVGSAAGRKDPSMEEIPTSSRKQRPLSIASFWRSGAWGRSWHLARSSWEVHSTHEDSAALHHR